MCDSQAEFVARFRLSLVDQVFHQNTRMYLGDGVEDFPNTS